MKRKISLGLIIAALLALLTLLISCGADNNEGANENTEEVGEQISTDTTPGLKFKLNDDGESYTLVGIGTCSEKDIVVKTYCDKSVTAIGDYAFDYCTSITSISIPDSVTSIGIDVFLGCESLTSIDVDENNPNYKDIDGNLYTKDGKTLVRYAIGKADTSFIVPDGVERIGDHSFWGCEGIEDVTIPNGVVTIGSYAFCNCYRLTSITIPESVTSITYSAFPKCYSLERIEVDENNPVYKDIDGNLYTKDGEWIIRYAAGKADTSFTIPVGVKYIDWKAFTESLNLKSVTLPVGITGIGSMAFDNCFHLEKITIPASVTDISEDALWECPSLLSLEVDENNTAYKDIDGNLYTKDGKKLIQYATGKADTSFAVPDGVNVIGRYAFYKEKNLVEITVADSVKNIEDSAFGWCESLTSITFLGTVAEWGEITKDYEWNYIVPATEVVCTDGSVPIE